MAEPGPEKKPLTVADLVYLAVGEDKVVMLQVRGEVFACTEVSVVFHEGRYVLMLDGETCD